MECGSRCGDHVSPSERSESRDLHTSPGRSYRNGFSRGVRGGARSSRSLSSRITRNGRGTSTRRCATILWRGARGGTRSRGGLLAGSRSLRRAEVLSIHDPKIRTLGSAFGRSRGRGPARSSANSAGRGASGLRWRTTPRTPRETPARRCFCDDASGIRPKRARSTRASDRGGRGALPGTASRRRRRSCRGRCLRRRPWP